MKTWKCWCLCLMFAASAHAAEPFDFIPDASPDIKPEQPAMFDGKTYLEFATNLSRKRVGGSDPSGNAALDANLSKKIGNGLRVAVNGRLDLDLSPGAGISHSNLGLTLREVLFSGNMEGWSVDLGRMLVRDGVALGFNPTDFFRTGSLLVRRTEDLARLRESRLGVVGARLAHQSALGQLSFLAAPGLTSPTVPAWYSPRWGATNDNENQYYFKYTPPTWNGLYTNLVLHRIAGGTTSVGLNASNNIGQSIVSYLEFAATRETSITDVALANTTNGKRRLKLAWGGSYTTETGQTFTAEYNFNGGGMRRAEWDGVWQGLAGADLGAALGEAGRRLDPATRHSLLVLVAWERFSTRDDDLSCLLKGSLVDRSGIGFCEWVLRKPHSEFAISASRYFGSERSESGSGGKFWVIGAKARFFF